tara:strand:- start:175 stop:519 length:345 start_codon:yes stop_codon:yes gene_type:complete
MNDVKYVYGYYTRFAIAEFALDLEDLTQRVANLKAEAVSKGWIGLTVGITSTMCTYEDYPDRPEVTIQGRRPATSSELKDLITADKVKLLADKMGVSHYEAGIINRLQENGKLK